MTDIQPNTRGQLQQAKKRLRRHLKRLRNADGLTAGQRDLLFLAVLTDLASIQLHTLDQSDGGQIL